MNEMTGLNIPQAEADLKNFHDSCNEVYVSLYNSFANLLTDLYRSWASPNAKTYTTSLISNINENLRSFLKERNILLQNASVAASILANVNGAKINGYFDIPEESVTELVFDFTPCQIDKNGQTGMDTAAVATIIASFEIQMRSALLQLDNLPKGISFYDQNNELISTYNTQIDHFNEVFNTMFTEISTKLKEYMKTETDNILLAKQHAVESLSA